MNKTTYTVTRFDIDDEFYVEVSPNREMIEFVLCMQNYGMKTFMFGIPENNCPEETWEELIENNVEEYIALFCKEMNDKER